MNKGNTYFTGLTLSFHPLDFFWASQNSFPEWHYLNLRIVFNQEITVFPSLKLKCIIYYIIVRILVFPLHLSLHQYCTRKFVESINLKFLRNWILECQSLEIRLFILSSNSILHDLACSQIFIPLVSLTYQEWKQVWQFLVLKSRSLRCESPQHLFILCINASPIASMKTIPSVGKCNM